jgi:hypothetical protein
MANTPLYKKLKQNGTTFFCFPGAAEDISAAYQNENYKMYFSKYVLLDFPMQKTNSDPKYFDFDNSFSKSSNASPAVGYQEQIVESLRNYVANQEVVIRESRLNNTEYYYNTNALETTTEKIFWKWCSKLNIIDFEPAIPGDEYYDNLPEFQSRNINDDEYFQEYLWKEREVFDWDTTYFYQSGESGFLTNLEIEFSRTSNFRVGDIINIYNVSNLIIIQNDNGDDLTGINTENGIQAEILKVISATGTQSQRIVVDIQSTIGREFETTGQARLVYHKLVRYIGEVTGISNVQEANRSYTEVHAHIPDHTGETPDILFRTMVDVNYKPNMTFPIIPSQYQPEIMGSEFFNSPIVSQPQNYPGSYFGQFDTLDFTYKTANGDELRRSGEYFGVSGDVNNIQVNGSTIDGITVNFNRSHYVKMNIPNRVVTNFDQFNALEVNNQPPKDFEFNAILWYYTVEDNNGNTTTNLYGISFLDNPVNNPKDEEVNLRFPSIKKLVTNGQQDGTSYAFNLSLNFNIINENPNETYNPEAINSLFSMNLFNNAMSRLASTNDSFLNILAEQSTLRDEISNLKGLLYSQTDLNIINAKIRNLEDLLRLYSTNQLVSSSTIQVNQIFGNPPSISLTNIDTSYARIDNIKTTELYNAQGIIPLSLTIPLNKNFLVNITNDDVVSLDLQDKLTLVLDNDLIINQTVDINITATVDSSENKRMDIFMISDSGSIDGSLSEVLLIGNIDLPVFYNSNSQLSNSAYLWRDFNFEIDFNQDIYLNSEDKLKIPFKENTYLINNSLKAGDVFYLNNLYLGTSSVYDFSGQYMVDSLDGLTSSYVTFDISNNKDFVTTYEDETFPYILHSSTFSNLSNKPYFSLNKGKSIRITRISNSLILKERYHIIISEII